MKIINDYLSRVESDKTANAIEMMRTKRKKEYDFDKDVRDYKEKCESWQDCPSYLAVGAYRRKLVNISQDKLKKYKAKGKRLAVAQIEAEKAKANDTFKIQSLNEQINNGSRAATITRQLIVWHELFENK